MNDLRYAFRLLLKSPGFSLDRDPHARARDRREHRDLQRRQRRPSAPVAAPSARISSCRCSRARNSRPAFSAPVRPRISATGASRTQRCKASRLTNIRTSRSRIKPSPERILGVTVSANYFRVLGAQPLLGRTFLRVKTRAPARTVVVLSEGLWRAQFGADPAIVGLTIPLDGRPFTVIGVMPASFRFPERTRAALGAAGRDSGANGRARRSRIAGGRAAPSRRLARAGAGQHGSGRA